MWSEHVEPTSPSLIDQVNTNVVSNRSFLEYGLRAPPGALGVPSFDRGWLTERGERHAFLNYLAGGEEAPVNWSESLEELHDRARAHFMDAWTRRAVLARLGPLAPRPTLIDIGCSTGYLLEDLARHAPRATLVGVDPIASGLSKAHIALPQALLLRADVCALPLEDACVDAVVSANVLEHVRDDEQALAEVFRILRPGARAVIVVPIDPSSYNYFDRVLGHERRYARGELARKARKAGLEVREDICLGAPLYPGFWLGKRYYQRRYGHLDDDALERRVEVEVEGVSRSVIGRVACRLEEALLDHGVRLPFGIRGLTVLARPASSATRTGPALEQVRSEASAP
jgi:SAM-dependent methyltransferase